jgi:hypothetical protein
VWFQFQERLTPRLHEAESFLRRLQVLRYSRNTPHFMEPELSLLYQQKPANCLCPELQNKVVCAKVLEKLGQSEINLFIAKYCK